MATPMSLLVDRAVKNGAVTVNSFSGSVRSVDLANLEKGDVITLPTEYSQIIQQEINGNKTEWIPVTTKSGKAIQFYPSVFSKMRIVYNEDLTPAGRSVHTMGTAAKYVQENFSDINSAMDAMKGKTICVSDVATIRTKRFGVDELQNATIPTLDFVDAEGNVVDENGVKVA